jgi:hypothetical protein
MRKSLLQKVASHMLYLAYVTIMLSDQILQPSHHLQHNNSRDHTWSLCMGCQPLVKDLAKHLFVTARMWNLWQVFAVFATHAPCHGRPAATRRYESTSIWAFNQDSYYKVSAYARELVDSTPWLCCGMALLTVRCLPLSNPPKCACTTMECVPRSTRM